MKWVTSEGVRVGRVSSAWLIERFVDPQAVFLFVPAAEVLDTARKEGARSFHIPGSDLPKRGRETAFEAIVKEYDLSGDRALVLLSKMVNGADTDNTLYNQPQGSGLRAIVDGFRFLNLADDGEIVEKAAIVFDALYAHCQQRVAQRDNLQ